MLENWPDLDASRISIGFQVQEEQVVRDSLHSHSVFEICFVIKGNGEWRIGDAVGRFRTGSLLIYPPQTLHCWRSDDVDGSPSRVSAIVLRFTEKCVPDDIQELPEMNAVKLLLEALKKPVEISVADRDRTRARLRSVERAQGALRLARFYVALELVGGYKITQVAASQGVGKNQRSRDSVRFDVVKRLIEERFASDLNRSEVAKELGLDEASFSRFFRRASGSTFADYLANYRIRHAARLLGTRRDYDLETVAAKSGFRSLPAFHRQFKSRLGTTPNRYRKAANSEAMAP